MIAPLRVVSGRASGCGGHAPAGVAPAAPAERPPTLRATSDDLRKVKAMQEEQVFLKGFMFAEQVLSGLGQDFDFRQVIARLMTIARGDVLLLPTTEEAVREIERQTGRSLPRNFRASVYGGLSDTGTGGIDRRKAQHVLQSMGYTASDWSAL
jgi:hypothetical protein